MPHRFLTTSTNRIVSLSPQPELPEYQYLMQNNRQLQDLILRFNLGVEGSFGAGGMQGLAGCCTPDGLKRMEEKFAGWIGQGVKELNLVSCEFLSFNLSEDAEQAQVFTYEKWVFVYADGRKVFTSGSIDGYDVRQVGESWRVDSVTFYAPNEQPG